MHLFSIAVALLAFVGSTVAQDGSPDALKDLAPTGKLRAAINLGNGVLAQKDPASSEPKGITPDLARELAKRLGVPLEMVVFESAGKVFDGAKTGAWDVAFIAIEPMRAAEIDFTAPYVIIEGTYMVPIFGVILGVLVLEDKLYWNAYLGCALILLGVMIVTGVFKLPSGWQHRLRQALALP